MQCVRLLFPPRIFEKILVLHFFPHPKLEKLFSPFCARNFGTLLLHQLLKTMVFYIVITVKTPFTTMHDMHHICLFDLQEIRVVLWLTFIYAKSRTTKQQKPIAQGIEYSSSFGKVRSSSIPLLTFFNLIDFSILTQKPLLTKLAFQYYIPNNIHTKYL